MHSVAQVERPADLVTRPGPAAIGGNIEAATLELLLGVVHVDHGGEQGDVGVASQDVAVRCDEAVEPARVGHAGDHLRPVEQIE